MITMELVQHVIVTLVAMAAAGLVVRRLVGVARPAPGAAPACANCPSNAGSCHVAPPLDAATAAPTTHPLVLVRPSRR